MTNGEMMVWAAVYARQYNLLLRPPDDVCLKINEPGVWDKFEEDVLSHAADRACRAVQSMRGSLPDIEEKFGLDMDADEDHSREVTKMLREMLDKRKVG